MTIGVSSGVVAGIGSMTSCASSTAAIRESPAVVIGDHRAASCLGLLDVADHLLEDVIVRRNGNDRHPFVNQGDRAVLHLARRVSFGMDVGDFLELERPLERDRIVDAAAEE